MVRLGRQRLQRLDGAAVYHLFDTVWLRRCIQHILWM